MSELTKEWLLKTIAELEEERDAVPGVVNEYAAMALAAMKLALASLEAESVAWLLSGGGAKNNVSFDSGNAYADPLREVTPLYTAPPAPVSVPECFKRLLHHAYGMTMGHDWNKGTMAGHHRAKLCHAVDECRAAMLQGAEPVTTAYKLPDAWVACVERMPSAGEQVLAYRPDAPESNDPLIKIATYVGGSAHGHGFDCYCKPTHWMPLPAAPQQESKP